MSELSHHESHVLALIRKWQPTTAYFVRKTLERGLASTFSSSPGSVYPVIERLKARGLVDASPLEADGRRTEQLACSHAGEAAVRSWITGVSRADLLPEDPWRTRAAFADFLSPDDRFNWLVALRTAARTQSAALAATPPSPDDEGLRSALENARLLNEARLTWIERLISKMVAQPGE